MTQTPRRILVFQTAFTGDVILTLPMIQRLKAHLPQAEVDIVATPSGASVLANHPALHRVIVYDKKRTQRGLLSAYRLAQTLRHIGYDVALIPHRSLRSGGVCYASRIPRRIGFSTSAARLLMTDVVPYQPHDHEIIRNMSLLQPLGIANLSLELPTLHPSKIDRDTVDALLEPYRLTVHATIVALAPGSVWTTKRWIPERYRELAQRLCAKGLALALVGGPEDARIAHQIAAGLPTQHLINAAGKLTLLQSAELIRRCAVIVCNDSSPMHLAVAMRTPVVAIFGATVPEFGFAPVGKRDRVVQTTGLACRPCAIHGGNRCPIGTFDCMMNISTEQVLEEVQHVLAVVPATSA